MISAEGSLQVVGNATRPLFGGGGPIIYTGVHTLTLARSLPTVMVSANRLLNRRSDFAVNRWLMDSGAFTRISSGAGHMEAAEYAALIERWSTCGHLEAAVSQDYMCEPYILDITGSSVDDHQRWTTERYLQLRALVTGVYVMPVLQGYWPLEYAAHLAELSPYIQEEAWVGVGSVCRRNGRPDAISAVLSAILDVRPDLRLHGFGVKATALARGDIRNRLYSVDSMAWSYAGRRRNSGVGKGNRLEEAVEWTERVNSIPFSPSQMSMGV